MISLELEVTVRIFLEPVIQSLKKSVEVIRSLFRWKHIDQLFLIPITMWTMVETGFLQAQFTRVREFIFHRLDYG